METRNKKSVGIRILLGIAGIAVGLIVQVVGAFVLKVIGLESGLFPAITVLLGFIVMGYLVFIWAII